MAQSALNLARTIPGPAIIETLPTGLVPLQSKEAVAARVAELLQGRPWVLVAAHAYYPRFDGTPIINVWTEPHERTAKGPNVEWCASVVLPEGARLDLLEPLLRNITGQPPSDAVTRERAAA
jgi:hypothetical protein